MSRLRRCLTTRASDWGPAAASVSAIGSAVMVSQLDQPHAGVPDFAAAGRQGKRRVLVVGGQNQRYTRK